MFRYISFIIIFFLLFPLECYSSPSVSAEAAIVIENTRGEILYSKNARKKLPMASTTKIMTAICAIENLDTNKTITVNDAAVGVEGSSVYLAKDEKITVSDLLYAMMLNSGNDAATALAYETSGSVEKFCALMNETAKRIGVENTNFTNPSGLWEKDHYTTAYDLALITRYALKNKSFAQIVSTRQKQISNGDKPNPRYLKNHNRLLGEYEGCVGVKTGFTKKCGRCLVSSAVRDGVSLTCVTLNAPDDWQDHTNLLDYGFSLCKSIPIVKEGDYCKTINTDLTAEGIRLCYKGPLNIVGIASKTNDAELVFDIKKDITLPVTKGETLGRAILYADGTECRQTELICDKTVLCPEKRSFRDAFLANTKRFFSLHLG